MLPILAVIAGKVVERIFNKDNPDSKTQIATASSLPVGTAAALMLMQDGSPAMQFLGGVLAMISAGLILYKDSKDDG